MSDDDSKKLPQPSDDEPKPNHFGTPETDQSIDAEMLAAGVGQEIVSTYPGLGRRKRLKVVKAFRDQIIPPGKPGRRHSKRISEAHADWKSGKRGIELYRAHIPGFEKMGVWRRKVEMQALRDAIRGRERRERKRHRLSKPDCQPSTK